MCLRSIYGIFFCLSLGQNALAQVGMAVPDGVSDTTVTYDDNTGRALVDIASPVTDGISHNSFTDFNVTEAGLDFDNRFAGARTIISEVTGSSRSLIEGDIEILGQRAHLFIANPNGILVDGSEFINTGGVVLTTSPIDFIERVPAPFRTQLNTTLEVSRGEIVIGEGGLSGAMDTLHILSKSLRIDGPVTNRNESAFSGIEITTGNSTAEFDSSLLPQNDLSQWSTVVAGEAEAEQAFLIDISERGALTGAQISALVTDAGAGVRHAGSILADRQGFSLTTDGQIIIDGGETVAATDIRYQGRGIEVSGIVPPDPDPVPDSPVRFVELEEEIDSTGLTFGGIFEDPLTVDQIVDGLEIADMPEIDETRAVFNSAFGGVELIATEGDISIGPSVFSSNLDVQLVTPEALSLDSSQVFTGSAINWNATSISITSDEDRTFIASNETVSLTASEGAVVLEGVRVQGVSVDTEQGETGGAVIISAETDVTLRSIDEDNLSVVFGVEGGIDINAGGDILNDTGRVIANGDITFVAGGDIENSIAIPDGSRDPFLQEGQRTGAPAWWTGFTRGRSIRETILDYGELEIENELAFITATDGVSFTAGGDVRNVGGQINANSGDLVIQARNVLSEGVVSGRFEYDRRCLILCSSRASSTLNVAGGTLSANGVLSIQAEDSIQNRGGFFTGLGGVTLEAEQLVFESVFLPQVVDRRSGLYNFWAGHSAWVYWRDQLGGVFSDENDIEIIGANEILLQGVELENLISNIDPTVVFAPRAIGSANDQAIGFFHELAPVLGN